MIRAARTSAVAVFAVAALVLGVSVHSASASVSATARSVAQQVNSGSWGAVASENDSPPFGTGPYSMTFDQKKVSQNFFSIRNSGSLTITGATFTIAASPNSPTVTVEACSTSWDETANTCTNSGNIFPIVSTSTTPATVSSPPVASGASFRLRATLTNYKKQDLPITATVGVSVDRSNVRSPSTANG